MSEQIAHSRIFLNKFTEELIMNIKTKIEIDERKKIEEERMKKAIEVEKLKQKFSQYTQEPKKETEQINEIKKVLEKQKPIQTPQVTQKPIITPQKIEPPKTTEKTEEIPAGFEKSIREEKPATGKIIKVEEKPIIVSKPVQINKPETTIKPVQIPAVQPLEPGEVDFGKITFLVKDPLISYVECPGENKNIVIKRAGGLATPTQIILSKEEIANIIQSFSNKARIPLIEGMLDARIGNLEMSAIISEAAASSFIVKRNLLPPPRSETVLQRPIQPQTTIQGPPMMMRPIIQPFNQQKR